MTLIVQLASEFTEAPQVEVAVKSALLAPVTVTLVMFRTALPMLLRVTV